MGDWDLDARELRLKQVIGKLHAGTQETRARVWGIRKGTQPDQDAGAGAWGDGDGNSGDLVQHLENQETGHQDRDMRNWDRDTEALWGTGEAQGPVQGHGVTRTQGIRTETWFWDRDTGDQDQEKGMRSKKLGAGHV